MANILLTGGAGYIGSKLAPALLESGHKVTVVDNFMYKQPSLAAIISNKNFELFYGDIRNYDLMKELLSINDVVIPLAAIVGAPACDKDPIQAKTINRDAILWMLDNLSIDQLILMPTTNSAYGSGDKENYCDENSPLNPLSTYAKDKVEVEKMLLNHPNSVSFRLATVFGISPRMRLDLLVNNFVYRAITDGFITLFESKFMRNYIHVSDVVNTFILALENWSDFRGEIFNVGLSDANISKLDLCIEIQKILPNFVFNESNLGKDPDQRNYLVSNRKIESRGFKPKISLQTGIGELVKGLGMFIEKPYTNI
jgi:nucleoside-diphosphate-sugar epimerase